jgi:N4-bis(aminopropyl)spermidine synthase
MMAQVGIEATIELVRGHGIQSRPLRRAIALLAERPRTLAELVRESGLPRRTVEELLTAIDDDLRRESDRLRLAGEAAAAYRERLAPPEPQREASPLIEKMARAIAAAPAPRPSLDHVPATAETVVRRALWLDATYDLSGARVLFLGDHDLTSLALAEVRPDVETAVIDVDDATLAYLDQGPRAIYGDLRLGLPPALAGWADLVFTDPPYTPDGVRLFCARGIQALRERDRGRLIVAYGFSARQPALGLKVQQAMQGLHLVFEAILPGFNSYQGAQAVASASDLYVCRPTSRSWAAPDRTAARAATLYTRGPQSEEGSPRPIAELAALLDRPAPRPAGEMNPEINLEINLEILADPGSWLLRVLLASNARRAQLLTRNGHPDLADQRGQEALSGLVAPKYRLRYRRSHPRSDLAVVEAELVDPTTLSPGDQLVRRLLDHAHGRVANVWREGLIELRESLTKNQARTIIAEACDDQRLLDLRLLDVPRHRLAPLLAQVAGSTS